MNLSFFNDRSSVPKSRIIEFAGDLRKKYINVSKDSCIMMILLVGHASQ